MLTFLVFNILLAGAEGRDPQANWWIGILSAAFVVMGYAFLGLDRILKRKNA